MKHIFESDIVFFQKEREKATKIFDNIEHRIAKAADKAIGEMLDEFFSDVNVCVYFDGENLSINCHTEGGYEISASWNEAIEFLLESETDIASAGDCEKIAQILQTTAAQFLEKAAEKRRTP